MKTRTLLSILACAFVLAGQCDCKQFYIATNGSNAWSGTLSQPNTAQTDGPFATLARARDAIRDLKAHGLLNEPVTVYLRGGSYYLNSTFTLTTEDSGTEDNPVSYVGYPGEDVVISGGKRISGFREVQVNGHAMLAADLPEVKSGGWYFGQLFVNDERRNRPRMPSQGFYRVKGMVEPPPHWGYGQDKFYYFQGDLSAAWRNLTDVDIVVLSFWDESRLPIKSIDENTRIVHLNKRSTHWVMDDFNSSVGARYTADNVFEALDAPGEWYLDRPTGTLYYFPMPGEDMTRATVVAPKLSRLVGVIGDAAAKKRVEYVNFANLRFANSAQADRYYITNQAADQIPGAFYLEWATNCSVTNCEVAHIGNYAIEIGSQCVNNRIERNRIFDMGAGGVKINEGGAFTTSEGTVVANNDIGDGGKIYMSAVGVLVGNSPRNLVVHNHIHDMNYTGISVGGVWGYGESKGVLNRIEYNHIDHIGRGILSDLGGIYTLGTSQGTVLRNNVIHDIDCNTYGGWGIYLDEGSSKILVENNVVYRTRDGGFYMNAGKDNIVRNNIIALSKDQQLQRGGRDLPVSFVFERNIVFYEEGNLLDGRWRGDDFKFDYNLYWTPSGSVDFGGKTFSEWKSLGHDTHSLVADPKFVDSGKGDLTLGSHSPAFELGFERIDLSRVGPRTRVGPREY